MHLQGTIIFQTPTHSHITCPQKQEKNQCPSSHVSQRQRLEQKRCSARKPSHPIFRARCCMRWRVPIETREGCEAGQGYNTQLYTYDLHNRDERVTFFQLGVISMYFPCIFRKEVYTRDERDTFLHLAATCLHIDFSAHCTRNWKINTKRYARCTSAGCDKTRSE